MAGCEHVMMLVSTIRSSSNKLPSGWECRFIRIRIRIRVRVRICIRGWISIDGKVMARTAYKYAPGEPYVRDTGTVLSSQNIPGSEQ